MKQGYESLPGILPGEMLSKTIVAVGGNNTPEMMFRFPRRADIAAVSGENRPAWSIGDRSDPTRFRQIGDVVIEATTQSAALNQLEHAVAERRSGAWGFCNAHTVKTARGFPGFRDALGQMTLFNDGLGLDIASRLLYGESFPENLNGTDLTPALLAALPAGTPVFLIGSIPGIADQAVAPLTTRFPNIRIVGTQHGYFAEQEEALITARIRLSGAQLVLVGMGHPVQEMWAVRNMATIDAPLLCVGAFLDFAAGKVSRAPTIVRALRSEWLYRLALEPRRLARRYLMGNLTFLTAVLRQRASGR
jgi:exopolysaccharide biosynthesis WecB/TagA/CpsF family protein